MKKLLALTICLIISIPMFSGIAFAQVTSSAEDDPCSKVGVDQDKSSAVYVILEEPLGGPDAKYCFRVCETNVKEKRICKIKSKCEAGSDLKEPINCQRIQILEAESGVNLLNQYVGLIYLWSAGTIGIIAVLTIVISGVQIMAAGGDSGGVENAKNRIVQALFGLIVLFLSGLLLYTINPTFFV